MEIVQTLGSFGGLIALSIEVVRFVQQKRLKRRIVTAIRSQDTALRGGLLQ